MATETRMNGAVGGRQPAPSFVPPPEEGGTFLGRLAKSCWSESRRNFGVGHVVSKAAMSELAGTVGGYTVPTEFSHGIMATVEEHSIVLPRATVIPMKSRETLCPVPNSVATGIASGTSPFFGGWRFTWNVGGQDGVNVPDFGDASGSAPFGQMSLVAWDLIGELLVSNQFLEDITPEGEEAVFKMASRAAAWTLEWSFLNGLGAGSRMPLGVLNAPATITVTRAGAGAIAVADVTTMARHMLPLGWNHSIWVCSPYALKDLCKIAGFVPNEDPLGTEMGCVGSLLTRPVFASEKLPTLGEVGDLIFFDPSMYVVGMRQDVEVHVSQDGPSFRTNSSYVKVWLRADGKPLLPNYATLEGTSGADQLVSCCVKLGAAA